MAASDLIQALLIFGSALVLEDAAVLGAALLAVNSMISLPWAASSSFAGIWLGDVGLYLIALHYGRPVLERSWFKRFFGRHLDLQHSEAWFQNHGSAAIVLSRAVPGTRLPTYLAAGLLRIPALRFFTISAAACTVWVAVLFAVSYHIGMMALFQFRMFRSEAGKLAACVAISAVLAYSLRSLFKRIAIEKLTSRLRRIQRWEFWPPAMFYIPVAAKYLSLAIKYRSLTLPTAANPGMYTGGLIGESKFETLTAIARARPDLVPDTYLVPFVSVEQQMERVKQLRAETGLEYPLVLKPDIGQRGFGFKIVRSDEDAHSYVKQFSRDLLVQRYVPGPHEAGIFYYRLPSESRGRIFAITEKVFPAVVGDGRRTLEALIRDDSRARWVADTYLRRFAADRGRIVAAGETLRLVEAGNHCQGAVFLDGGRLFSDELEQALDEVSKCVPGFFVGRYDIRYTSEAALRQGRDFQIIELNGAASEATSIYDPRNSLRNAYRTLFRQWEIIFAIAHENRIRGCAGTPLRTIWQNWIRYQRQMAGCPVSD